MNAKNYLQEIYVLDIKWKQKEFEYKNMKESYTSVHSVDYSRVRMKNIQYSSGFTKRSDEIMDMYDELQKECIQFNRLRHERIKEIQMMDKIEYMNILFKRFVEYKSVNCIAEEMNYTYKYSSKLLNLALKAFEEKYKDKLEEYCMYIDKRVS